MIYVVDASIAVKWFMEEVHSDAALFLLDDRFRLHGPALLLMEFDNVLCKRIRRSEISIQEGIEIRGAMRLFPVELHSDRSLLSSAFCLANKTHSSLYDCIYLALAIALEGCMVTADRRFYEALQGGPLKKNLIWVEDLR